MEDSFEACHGIKPVIYWQIISNNSYKVKLNLGGKEIILQETLEKGLTKLVTSEYQDQVTNFDSVYKAEQAATEILRS